MATPNESIGVPNHFEYVLSGGTFPHSTLGPDGRPCRQIKLAADGDITVKRNSDSASVVITGWPKGVPITGACTEITTCTVNCLVSY